MRNWMMAGIFASMVALGAGCDKDKDGGGAAAAQVSDEMKAFMADFGSSSKVSAALKKHGVDGLDNKDMDMYDLKDPKVTKSETRGAQTCYTLDAKAGVTTRTYDVCWEGGKIAAVEDKGMR
jgi:hypothetical protein